MAQRLQLGAQRQYERAEQLGMFGDADRAFELSVSVFRSAVRLRDADLLPRSLEQLVRHAWAAARYGEALPLAEWYVRETSARASSSPHHVRALLIFAHMLTTLGRVEEALAILNETEALDLPITLDDVARMLHQRAFALGQLGYDDVSVHLYRRAAEIARKRSNPNLTAQVLNNFAVHMRYVGNMDEALALHGEVIDFVQRAGIAWREQYYVTSQAVTCYFAGRLDQAEALYERAAVTRPENKQVAMATANLAIFLGVAADRPDLLERYGDDPFLEDAFRSQEPFRIGNAVAAKHRVLTRVGALAEATALLHRALSVLQNPYCCNLLFLEIASHGEGDVLERALEHIQRMNRGSQVRAAFGYLLRARALAVRRDQTAFHEADRATLLFERLRWPLHQAVALELAGRFREAAQLYGTCHAVAEARRTKSRHRRAGRPRRTKGQLTTREWEIAKLCVGGLRNREIASRLGVGIGTVEFHVRNILRELDLTSRYELRDALAELR